MKVPNRGSQATQQVRNKFRKSLSSAGGAVPAKMANSLQPYSLKEIYEMFGLTENSSIENGPDALVPVTEYRMLLHIAEQAKIGVCAQAEAVEYFRLNEGDVQPVVDKLLKIEADLAE